MAYLVLRRFCCCRPSLQILVSATQSNRADLVRYYITLSIHRQQPTLPYKAKPNFLQHHDWPTGAKLRSVRNIYELPFTFARRSRGRRRAFACTVLWFANMFVCSCLFETEWTTVCLPHGCFTASPLSVHELLETHTHVHTHAHTVMTIKGKTHTHTHTHTHRPPQLCSNPAQRDFRSKLPSEWVRAANDWAGRVSTSDSNVLLLASRGQQTWSWACELYCAHEMARACAHQQLLNSARPGELSLIESGANLSHWRRRWFDSYDSLVGVRVGVLWWRCVCVCVCVCHEEAYTV